MELNSLEPAKGSVKFGNRRLGRGQGSGRGGTSTRGHKGAKSRSGYSRKIGFEGGQMPLQRRLPKYGFKNINRKEYTPINLSDLQNYADSGVEILDKKFLYEKGKIKKTELVKILGKGELKTKLEVSVDACSQTALKAIESLGGKVVITKNTK